MNISPEDFMIQWTKDDDDLIKYPEEHIQVLPIPEESREFLIMAGLPPSAAPNLQFSVPTHRLEEHYGNRYYCIGYNGIGDPICIDKEANGEIRILLHEQEFTPGEFVNSSIPQLAMSLLAYREFYRLNWNVVGDGVLTKDYAVCSLLLQLRETLEKIDPMSLQEESFWIADLERWKEFPGVNEAP